VQVFGSQFELCRFVVGVVAQRAFEMRDRGGSIVLKAGDYTQGEHRVSVVRDDGQDPPVGQSGFV